MASNLPQTNTEARMHLIPDAAKSRHTNGPSRGAIWPQGPWGLFLPLMVAGNVVVATLAWIIVGLVMR
jgi:hypothetical protein